MRLEVVGCMFALGCGSATADGPRAAPVAHAARATETATTPRGPEPKPDDIDLEMRAELRSRPLPLDGLLTVASAGGVRYLPDAAVVAFAVHNRTGVEARLRVQKCTAYTPPTGPVELGAMHIFGMRQSWGAPTAGLWPMPPVPAGPLPPDAWFEVPSGDGALVELRIDAAPWERGRTHRYWFEIEHDGGPGFRVEASLADLH